MVGWWIRRFDACRFKRLGGLGTVVDNARSGHWVTRIGDHAERWEMWEMIESIMHLSSVGVDSSASMTRKESAFIVAITGCSRSRAY